MVCSTAGYGEFGPMGVQHMGHSWPGYGNFTASYSSVAGHGGVSGLPWHQRNEDFYGSYAYQVFDQMPITYGFRNLDRRCVFLADGTEHTYFALPTEHTLELSTSPMRAVDAGRCAAATSNLQTPAQQFMGPLMIQLAKTKETLVEGQRKMKDCSDGVGRALNRMEEKLALKKELDHFLYQAFDLFDEMSEHSEGVSGCKHALNELSLQQAPIREAAPKLPNSMPISQIWTQKSSLAGEHAAVGNFDTAIRLLSRQLGIKNFAPLKPMFLDLHMGSHSYLRALATTPVVSVAVEKGWSEYASPNVRGLSALVFTFSQM